MRQQPRGDIEPHQRTTIYHLPGEQSLALQVARYVTGGADLKVREDLGLSSGQVAVATGADFTTVHMQPTPVDKMPDRGPGSGITTTTPSQYTIGDPPSGTRCG